MAQHDIANLRMAKHFARQDYERQSMGARSSGGSFDDCGPPNWDRGSWEAFKAQYGFYPFGNQGGTVVNPPTFEGAPPWVYELMGQRQPPITVVRPS